MEKVKCQICGEKVVFIELHLANSHGDMSVAEYKTEFPDAPLCSASAMEMLKSKEREFKTNKPCAFDIKETFGVSGFGKKNSVAGMEKMTEFVPEVDSAYFFRRELLGIILYSLENFNEPTLLIGPTGSGKTSIVEQACARLNLPVTRVNLDGDVARSDFVGQWVLTGDNAMQFHYGPLPTAMKEGRVLIVDEIDAGAPPVTMVIQAVLEGKPLTLLETGETIVPHKNFRIFATANTNGQGDETGLYFGTQPQNYAMFDRFKLVGNVDYPGKEEERTVVFKKTGISDTGVLEKLVEVASIIRESNKKGECSCTMSTRNVVNIASKMLAFGTHRFAYSVAYINKLNTGDADFCNEVIQRVWG